MADGAYDFTFALYATETAGESLWSEVEESIEVLEGGFLTSLGGNHLIPASILEDSRALWLAVGVRGPGQAEFTTLVPRQRLGTVSSAIAASPNNGAACPHDHVGEVRYANVDWSNAGLTVVNSGNGPSILGWNTGGGNALRGQGTGASLGLYAESEDGAGTAPLRVAGSEGREGGGTAPPRVAGE